ncbi:GNAT family N-acetyltransferase [Candidatus Clostridium radicumherbarum]|uniref:GNAT family N-acetyltransferase n=1 Tax=Candidatus Clostridium radicumherbarum TaxID=3381662 RepID=A0ABW8TXH5_9CLOT
MLIPTQSSKAIMDFLKKDLLINLNIIGIIENEPNVKIFVDNVEKPKGIVVDKGYFHFIYSKDNAFLEEVIESFNKDGYYGFSAIYESIANKIKERYKVIDWDNPCTLYYLPKENLDLGKIKNEVRTIDVKDAETINYYYEFQGPDSLEEIRKDIMQRPSSGVYKNGELVSWAITHDDNSLGIMYTKKEHRRMGYAEDVTIDLAAKHIMQGKIPFLHIIERNNMSPGLAKKCGFVECGKVVWFGIKVGNPKES